MKPIVALDLSLFAVPNTAETQGEVEEIFNRIRSWASVIDRQNCVTFVTMSNAIDVLSSANCFPATHNIRALLELHKLENVFSANDINTRMFSMLQKASRLSDIIGYEVIKLETADIDGADISKSPDVSILSGLACLVASISLSDISNMIRITTAFPCDDAINIVAKAELLDKQGVVEPFNSEILGEVRAIEWPADFLGSLDPQVLWERAEDAVEVHLAISLEIAKMHGLPTDVLPLKGVPNFCIGTDFMDSLIGHDARSAGTLANIVRVRCAQVMTSKPQAAPKAFSEIRAQDGAQSFRVHLSKDHAAFRLMLWVRPGGVTEFANIGVKSELMICGGEHRSYHAARFS